MPSGVPSVTDDEIPPRNPDKYGQNVHKRAALSVGLVGTFFKDSVQRARDRNARAKDLDAIIADPNLSDARKEQKRNQTRRAEAQFLRFLRTRERPDNFSTLKIIGKGAFGEVRLVQRKNDGKIYALKSLIKSEKACDDMSGFFALVETSRKRR